MKPIIFAFLFLPMLTMVTSVSAHTNASGVSELFTLDVKSPNVTILSPSPGEQFLNTVPVEVTWTAFDDNLAPDPISISLIVVPEETHPLLENSHNSGTTEVMLPNIITNRAIVRVSAVDLFGNVGQAQTPGYISLVDSSIDVAEIKLSDSQFRAFPNPANDNIWVEFFKTRPEAAQLELVDVMGRVVARQVVEQKGFVRTSFSLDGLNNGLYLIRLETVNGYAINKILVR